MEDTDGTTVKNFKRGDDSTKEQRVLAER